MKGASISQYGPAADDAGDGRRVHLAEVLLRHLAAVEVEHLALDVHRAALQARRLRRARQLPPPVAPWGRAGSARTARCTTTSG
jgi:hypothetical protein